MKSHYDLLPSSSPSLTPLQSRWQVLQRSQAAIISALKGYTPTHKLSSCELYIQCLGHFDDLAFKTVDGSHVLSLSLDLRQACGSLAADKSPPKSFVLPPEACQLYTHLDGSFKVDLVQQVNLSIALAHRQAQ